MTNFMIIREFTIIVVKKLILTHYNPLRGHRWKRERISLSDWLWFGFSFNMIGIDDEFFV